MSLCDDNHVSVFGLGFPISPAHAFAYSYDINIRIYITVYLKKSIYTDNRIF